MDRYFNEGDTIRSHLDGKDYTIVQVWGEILNCTNEEKLIELMDFEVDLINKNK